MERKSRDHRTCVVSATWRQAWQIDDSVRGRMMVLKGVNSPMGVGAPVDGEDGGTEGESDEDMQW
jgi:hypothetical protein